MILKTARLLLAHAAWDNMGIYPAATILPDRSESKRTAWQDGWNAAVTEITSNIVKYYKWFDKLEPSIQHAVYFLLDADVIQLGISEAEEIKPYVLMNDTFGYACADSEDVPLSELPRLVDIWARFQYPGVIAWAAKKRNYAPLKEVQTPEYLEAFNSSMTAPKNPDSKDSEQAPSNSVA